MKRGQEVKVASKGKKERENNAVNRELDVPAAKVL